jgi:hypothetical protein
MLRIRARIGEGIFPWYSEPIFIRSAGTLSTSTPTATRWIALQLQKQWMEYLAIVPPCGVQA